MEAQEIHSKLRPKDYQLIAKKLEGLYTERTVRAQLKGERTLKEPVKNAAQKARDTGVGMDHIGPFRFDDAAQSERFNRDAGVDYWKYTDDDFADKAVEAKVRGNNTWDSSCIRTWLNSDEQVVSYEGAVPSGKVMSDMKNGYEHEAGFLCGFTQEEQDAIVTTQVRSKGNVLSKDSAQVTDDKVFLLDMEELEWLREADVSILAKPTEAAVREDETHWYGAYSLDLGTDNYFWWLREPVDGSVSQCHIVSNGVTGEMVTVQTVGVEGFGIRPAVTVDVDALARLTDRSALSR